MRLRKIGVLVCLCCLAGCNQGRNALDLAQFVPVQVAGWRATGLDQRYDRSTIFQYIDGAGEVYLQYSFRNVFVREFERPDQPRVTVQVFDMGSSEDAFGIFSLERADESAGIGVDSEYGGGLLRFWKGPYLVCVSAEGEAAVAKNAVFEFGRQVAAAIPDAGRRPELVESLPAEGLVAERVRFFHTPFGLASLYPISDRNVLALAADTEAVLASYRLEGASVRAIVVRYPDPGRAAAAAAGFEDSYAPPLGPDGVVQMNNGRWAGARRVGPAFAAVFDAASREQLEGLLGRITRRLEDATWTK